MIHAGADIDLERIGQGIRGVAEGRKLRERGRRVGIVPVRCGCRRERAEIHIRGVIGRRTSEAPQRVVIAVIEPGNPAGSSAPRRGQSQLLAELMGRIVFDTVLRARPGRAIITRVRKTVVSGIGNSFGRIIEGLAGLLDLRGVSGPSRGTRCQVERWETVVHIEAVGRQRIGQRFSDVKRLVVRQGARVAVIGTDAVLSAGRVEE